MPILTVGMVVNKVPETLMAPGTSLALDIYYFASHGYPDEAAATAVVLLVFVMILNLLAGFIGNLIRKSTYGDQREDNIYSKPQQNCFTHEFSQAKTPKYI